VGGAVGFVPGLLGHYARQGGDAAIKWANDQWKNGGFPGKVGAVFGWAGSGLAKGVGFAVQKVGNAASWVADKVGNGVRRVGNAISDGAKTVARGVKKAGAAVASGVKSAGKAIGKGVKKIFSGW
jgi:hypothetical protein